MICSNCGNEVVPKKSLNQTILGLGVLFGLTPGLLYLMYFGRQEAKICPICGKRNDRPKCRQAEMKRPWYTCDECRSLSPQVAQDYAHRAATVVRSSLAPVNFKLAYLRTRNDLAAIAGTTRVEVDEAYADLEAGDLTSQVVREYRRLNLGPSGVEFGQACVICLLIRLMMPERVVETGVGGGLSSTMILKALEDNGRGSLDSLDLREGAGQLIPQKLRARWRLHVGTSRDLLPRVLDGLGEIDFFFHDSFHSYENMTFEFESAHEHLAKGGVLASHDVGRGEGRQALEDFRKDRDYPKSMSYGELGVLLRGES